LLLLLVPHRPIDPDTARAAGSPGSPTGTELLRENEFVAGAPGRSASDPASTRAPISAARRRRSRCSWPPSTWRRAAIAGGWSCSAVAGSGIAAVVIGISHRIFGFTQLYGIAAASTRTLLTGPFVNGNHTSEFLELAAFTCLACRVFRRTAL
jgi:hypothetical protein